MITATKAGSYVVSDNYGGDTNYTSVASNADTVSVAKATASDTLKASLNPTSVASAVTYTATVTGAAGAIPTGTVTFEDGGVVVASCAGHEWGRQPRQRSGDLYCHFSLTTGSPHQVTAPYGGDGSYTVGQLEHSE